MIHLLSFDALLRQLLATIVISQECHAKWLNTLSFLENCGARKIAACEHPTLVKEEMLKHAAEEFRHAHYLKRQIEKVLSISINDYSLSGLLGGVATLHYLTSLDFQASRYLLAQGFSRSSIKEAAYILVTYAIELRAGELYPIYDEILRKVGSKVAVKSILLEEKEHLREMEEALRRLPLGFIHAERICAFEKNICRKWLYTIAKEIGIDCCTKV